MKSQRAHGIVPPNFIKILWMIPGALFICVALSSSPALSAIPAYNPEAARDIKADESTYNWIIAHWFRGFPGIRERAENLGYTIAGQAEFPWVVFMETEVQNGLYQGIGNLITKSWVLGDCYTLRHDRQFHWLCADQARPGSGTVHLTFKVYICANHMQEDFARFDVNDQILYRFREGTDVERNADFGVIRHIDKIIPHPKCDTMRRYYNFAFARMTHPINLYLPVVGFMPLFNNPMVAESGQPLSASPEVHFGGTVYARLKFMNGKSANFKKMVCYVGSFGQEHYFSNIPPHRFYKTKMRVYYTNYADCVGETLDYSVFNALCHRNGNDPHDVSEYGLINATCSQAVRELGDGQGNAEHADAKPFMCFRQYSQTGYVCDHDRGAPLVCDGEVFGFVTRGVPHNFCTPGSPFPFLIQRADLLEGARLFPPGDGEPNWGDHPPGWPGQPTADPPCVDAPVEDLRPIPHIRPVEPLLPPQPPLQPPAIGQA